VWDFSVGWNAKCFSASAHLGGALPPQRPVETGISNDGYIASQRSVNYAMIDATPSALAKLAEVLLDAQAEASNARPHA
jgi:hypothetical protein